MRRALLLFLVLASFASPAARAAEDLQFLDGKVWSAVRILERGEGYLLVMHERGVYTVWGATLTEECTLKLGITRISQSGPTIESTPVPVVTRQIEPTHPDKDLIAEIGPPPGFFKMPSGPRGILFDDEKEVSGQVFIATRGGNSVKLGNVVVSVIDDAAYGAFLDYMRENFLPWTGRILDNYERFKNPLERDRLLAFSNFLESSAIETLPTHAVGKTDADGRFHIRTILKPPFYLHAAASRLVGGKTDRYEWFVRVTSDDLRTAVFLSNDNLRFTP